jgi:predicted dinucleotide-binding enzyme
MKGFNMKLAVIGSGNIGKSIGAWASKVGYEVIFSAKNLQHAQDAAKAAGSNAGSASVYASQDSKIKGNKIAVFYAGDDKEAKSKVADLIGKMGFDSVDAGALKAARNLAPMALLNIGLGYCLGHGTSIGFSFLR